MEKCYQKIKYQSIPKIKEQYKKRYQENPELHEKIKKLGITNVKKRTKVVKAPITFAQYAIEACINLGANFLNMKHDMKHHTVKSFAEKLYKCETRHKHLCKNETTPCQAVCNKMALDPTHDESKNRKSPSFQENFL